MTANVIKSEQSDRFALYHGDCVEVLRGLPSESVGYSIFSPPFSSLYTYTDSPRDLGNCDNDAQFFAHFGFVAAELMRLLKPGRLVSLHCMLLPTSKSRDGFIGLRDFRGDLIRSMQSAGFVFHSEVTIWKDPVTAMQRTKALGLLHKQLRKDSAMSRHGVPDYLVTMRKPGINPEPIAHHSDLRVGDPQHWRDDEPYPVELWQRVASPVWVTTRGVDDEGFAICVGDADGTDHGTILAGDTLQKESAREEKDERHICPLQLSVIRRALKLWTRPNDVVCSPFAGIGSEGYVSLQEGRRFVGAELKASYYKQAVANLRAVERRAGAQGQLFA